jgi:HK97 family phage major capsid protein
MKSYANVVRAVLESPWAILPTQLLAITEIVEARAAGVELTVEEVRVRLEAAQKTRGERNGGFGAARDQEPGFVAVIPVYGTIMPRATLFSEFSGGTSIDGLRNTFQAAMADDQVKAVIFDIDSPGGAVSGVPELAAEIRAARGGKPIVAVANYLAASAAYWLGVQADEFVVSDSAIVGSIGVYTVHQDQSALEEKIGIKTTLIAAGPHKVEGNPHEPLSDEAAAAQQAMVDNAYGWFVDAVAAGRGVSAATVLADFGGGRVFQAADAVAAGMADRVATLNDTIAQVIDDVSRPRGARALGGFDMAAYVPIGTINSHLAPGTASATASTFTDATTNELFAGTVTVTEAGAAELLAALPEALALDDRQAQMEPDATPEIEEPAVEPVPATPGAQDPARDEMLTAVSQLTVAVQEMSAGKVDRETIENLADEVTRLQAEVDASKPREGFVPEDLLPARGKNLGLAELHQIPAAVGARLTGKNEDDLAEFHRASDNLLLLSAATKKSPRELNYYADSFIPAMGAAMDSVTATEGDEWVPTLLSGNLIERVELALRVVDLFQQIEMPSNPYEIPGFGLRVRGGRASENTADTGQTGFRKVTPLTRKITLTAVKFASEALVSKEAEEDSLVPILDFIRGEITSQLAVDQEDAVINGDTTGPHMDLDVTDPLDPRKNWNGLRKLAVAGAKTDGAAAILTAAMLRVNRKKMGKYGVDSTQLVHIIGIGQYINMLSDANLLTVDKYGPDATILRGELAKVDGIPIIVSEYVQQNYDATGVVSVTGANNIKSIALTVNRNGFLIGNRRSVTVQLLTELYAEYDQDAVAVSMRRAFVPRQVATDPLVALTYNLLA